MGCLADVVYALFLLFVWKDRKDCLFLQSRIIRTIYVRQSIDYRKNLSHLKGTLVTISV